MSHAHSPRAHPPAVRLHLAVGALLIVAGLVVWHWPAGLDVTFDVATAQALPFPDARFDVVLCTLALHHLPDAARAPALAEMCRVTRPGGRVLIVEFGRGHGPWAVLNPVALLHGRDARHVLDDAAARMREVGLRDVTVGPIGSGVVGHALGRVEAPHG